LLPTVHETVAQALLQEFMKRRSCGQGTNENREIAVSALAALAHEHRLHIFRLLVKCRPSGMRTSEIARQVGVSPTNLSFHLAELDHAGLLRRDREGRYIRYAINVDTVRWLLTYLAEDCCLSDVNLLSQLSAASRPAG
jgi:DNA-binding transcriptional ArsR family regulator